MPAKLSPVPPVEVPVIGCDRHPDVPVTIEIQTIKGGCSFYLIFFFRFFGKIHNNQGVVLKSKECCSTRIY